jgi:hypothetical protein
MWEGKVEEKKHMKGLGVDGKVSKYIYNENKLWNRLTWLRKVKKDAVMIVINFQFPQSACNFFAKCLTSVPLRGILPRAVSTDNTTPFYCDNKGRTSAVQDRHLLQELNAAGDLWFPFVLSDDC